MRKVIIVDNHGLHQRFNSQWSFHASKEIESWGFDVSVVTTRKGKLYSKGFLNSFWGEGKVNEGIAQLINNNKIPDDTIFIFTDAHSYAAYLLHEYRTLNNLNYTLIGFWTDSIFFLEGNIRARYRGREFFFVRKMEESLARCYDINLVSTEHFREEISKKSLLYINSKVCALPFSKLLDVPNNYSEFEKEDIILLLSSADEEHDVRTFKSLKSLVPESYALVVCHEGDLTEIEYHRLLARSKMAVSVSKSNSNPYHIFEALLFGVYPLIPDIPAFKDIFNEQFLYDHRILRPPHINFIRGADKIIEISENVVEQEHIDPIVISEAQRIHEKYYNSNQFKEIICSIT